MGDQLQVQAQVHLGTLNPTDVAVELYHGRLNAEGLIVEGQAFPMLIAQSKGNGKYVFAGAISCRTSGRHGYALRILPHHETWAILLRWGLSSGADRYGGSRRNTILRKATYARSKIKGDLFCAQPRLVSCLQGMSWEQSKDDLIEFLCGLSEVDSGQSQMLGTSTISALPVPVSYSA